MTEMYDKITTHEDSALDRQVWQYKEKTNFDNLIKIHADRMQKLENVLYDLLVSRAISTASGQQLDNAGEYLQVLRGGLGDESYRAQLLSAASKLRKAGQVEVLLDTLRSLTGKTVSLLQVFPCNVFMHVFVDGFSELSNEDLIYSTMQSVKAAGVRLEIGKQTTENSPLTFSDNINGGAVGQGFSTLADGSDGGSSAELLET